MIDAHNQYEYDVAFSFSALDEAVATEINDLLADRLKTFIYSARQREIAGTDGQESFSKVYGQTARLVVIFYRKEWGQTPWTRVEMDAIKTRSLEDGWDFTVFVPTEAQPTTPPWLPKTRLYVGLERWGASGAAAVIESRVAERGGQTHVETVIERAQRFKRASDLEASRAAFARSQEGLSAYAAAKAEFAAAMEEASRALVSTGVAVEYLAPPGYNIIQGLDPVNLVCEFRARYANTLEGAQLLATVWKGFPELPGFFPSLVEARKVAAKRYTFQLVTHGHAAFLDDQRRAFSGQQLADELLKIYFDAAARIKPD